MGPPVLDPVAVEAAVDTAREALRILVAAEVVPTEPA
jgi:hypothetical protein